MQKNTFKKLPFYAKFLIIFFGCILALAAIGAGVFYWYVGNANKMMNSVTSSEIENILTPVESIEEPVTILLLGKDTRDPENDAGRADTIMLLYLNPERKQATLLSIPRDTLVEIPGFGENKINAAYAFGGEKLMIETVSKFLNADINHYITIDFDGFVKLIDALGGVDIVIDRPLTDPKSGANFSVGNHHLTGEQALSFTRSRSTELADIGRIQRQQLLLRYLVDQKLNVQYLSNIPKYFNILVSNTLTDLDLVTLLRYGKTGLSYEADDFETAIIPTHADWIENNTISVQIPDIEEARAMWQRIIDGKPAGRFNAVYSIAPDAIPDALATEMVYEVQVTVKNTGAITWERDSKNPVLLGYHWINFDTRDMTIFDGKRCILPKESVAPGEEVTFDMRISSPPQKGKYILQIDLVQEGMTWFSYQGVPPIEKYCTLDISYSARYDDKNATPDYLEPGEEFSLTVAVKNTGYMLWEHYKEKGRVNLGTHWVNRDTQEVEIWDGQRGLLPFDVAHNEGAEVKITIVAPQKPGRYILQYDMVHEGYKWFSQEGVIPLEININVGETINKQLVKATSVKVFNGNGTPNSATDFIQKLEKYGFKTQKPSNAKDFNFEKTIILYKSGSIKKAQQLALLMGSYELVQFSEKWNSYKSSSDLSVILGKDYKENIN